MAGYDRHRAELTHSPRVAEQNAVKQAPADIGQRDMPEGLPAAGAKRKRRLLILPPLLGHQRDQFACNERNGDEDRRKPDSRPRTDDFYVLGPEPSSEERRVGNECGSTCRSGWRP